LRIWPVSLEPKRRSSDSLMPKQMLAGADTARGTVHLPFEQIVGHPADQFQGGVHLCAPRLLSITMVRLTRC
jgi:hypothetical protein